MNRLKDSTNLWRGFTGFAAKWAETTGGWTGEVQPGMDSGPREAAKESRLQSESVDKGFDSGGEQDDVRSRDGESEGADVVSGAATYTDATGM